MARHSLESGSYYAPWVATYLGGLGARFPLMDGVGTTRRLVTSGNTAWDRYELDAFGADRGSWTNYHNPYRYGAAWGYITDPSGYIQLGARFYWPEVGRFVSQDPMGDGVNWYAYAASNPVVWVDPEGLAAGQSLRLHQHHGHRAPPGSPGGGRRVPVTPPPAPKPKPKPTPKPAPVPQPCPSPQPKPDSGKPPCEGQNCCDDFETQMAPINVEVASACSSDCYSKVTGSTDRQEIGKILTDCVRKYAVGKIRNELLDAGAKIICRL